MPWSTADGARKKEKADFAWRPSFSYKEIVFDMGWILRRRYEMSAWVTVRNLEAVWGNFGGEFG